MALKTIFPFLLAFWLYGCNRTIYVPSGKAVRLREPVEAAVWVFDKNGALVPGYMVLPEGWYVLPDPGEGEEDGS